MRKLLLAAVVAVAWFGALGAAAQANAKPAEEVLRTWYQLVLELVRHTPTYSPPVASRSFAYLGVTAFEAVATGSAELQSLAGQLNGLTARAATRGGQDLRRGRGGSGRHGICRAEFFREYGPDRPTGHGRTRSKIARGGFGGIACRCRGPQRSIWPRGCGTCSGVVAR